MSTSYAVIGASRGIGLEYVRQLSSRPDSTVFAVVRNKQGSAQLTSFAETKENLHIIEGDVADHPSLQRAAEEVGRITGGTLDVLIHGAARMTKDLVYLGFNDYATMDDLDADFVDAFRVNTLGVVHSIDAFLPLLRAGRAKKAVVISTPGASYSVIRQAQSRDMVAYNATKAAATMVAVKYAVLLAPEGFTVVTLSPGLVETDATARADDDSERTKSGVADLHRGLHAQTPAESVALQLGVIDGLTVGDSGKFLAHTGSEFTD